MDEAHFLKKIIFNYFPVISLSSVCLSTGVPKSRFEESIKYLNDLCTRIECDVTTLGAWCYVTY